jgi:hypothetical protein
MEALQQRHEELTKRGEEAASRGDNSKARRMERLSKVILSFIRKLHFRYLSERIDKSNEIFS